MTTRWLLPVPLLILLSACGTLSRSGGYFEDDGPGANPPANITNIPDAVPKSEPRAGSGNNPYVVYGKTYQPLTTANGYHERGIASWYGRKFNGKRTSSGEPYDMYAMTAAHKTLPLPSYARVRNLQNGRSIVVRINDRGPFLNNRLIDLSYAAAAKLGILGTGTGIVEVDAVSPDDTGTQYAGVKTYPLQVISPAAAAEELPPSQVTAEALPSASTKTAPAPAKVVAPKLYLQVGAFTQRDNAEQLRDRLDREALRPVFVQTAQIHNGGAPDTTIYRVRIGPLTSVEQGDRLTQRAARLGVTNPLIVVE
ncbi:MAG: septal ring lytic transglycosylase RlpA family protein [Sulfuricaulis sp.]